MMEQTVANKLDLRAKQTRATLEENDTAMKATMQAEIKSGMGNYQQQLSTVVTRAVADINHSLRNWASSEFATKADLEQIHINETLT